ncbi:MAG TPA: hypothetical protein VGH45_11150 [Solirubrobacteraceae bacterium]|jgi:hypothetical protein
MNDENRSGRRDHTRPDDRGDEDEIEIVDGLPVLAEVRPVGPQAQAALPEAVPAAALPAVQAARAAATGFLAGAATVALVRVLGGRRRARARVSQRRGSEGLPIIGTRSFLVDVHLIAKPGE